MAIIKKETQGFRRRVKPIWVKGHQTADDPSISASTYNDVQGNNRADKLATWYREDSGKRQSSNQTDHVPESLISISLNGRRLASQVEACIRYHIDGYHLRSYLQSTNKWSDNTWDSIDIEALGVFIKRMDYKSQIARTKFVFDQWHTGYRRHQIAKRKDPILLKCPCCTTVTESTTHVLRCKENPERDKCLRRLRKALTSSVFTLTFQLIKDGIFAWLSDTTPTWETDDSVPLQFRESASKAMLDQSKIGWEAALKGYLSVEWRHMVSLGMSDGGECHYASGLQGIRIILRAFHEFT
jgi:hypothetical protein